MSDEGLKIADLFTKFKYKDGLSRAEIKARGIFLLGFDLNNIDDFFYRRTCYMGDEVCDFLN